jgi:hypothetical protein
MRPVMPPPSRIRNPGLPDREPVRGAVGAILDRMALTEHEKAMVRHHLGYPEVSAISTFQLGVPMAIEPSFMIEGAMNRLRPEAEDITRMKLATLTRIEAQMVDDLELLAVAKVEEIELRRDEQQALRQSYDYWVDSLANDFRVLRNPFDYRLSSGGPNVSVIH